MGVSSSINTVIPISLIHVKMEENAELTQKLDSQLNSMIYVFSGKVTIYRENRVKENSKIFGFGVKQELDDGELGILSKGNELKIRSNENSEFLILAGPELDEPIARYGPFVMNTREEVEQAFLDYQNGTFVS